MTLLVGSDCMARRSSAAFVDFLYIFSVWMAPWDSRMAVMLQSDLMEDGCSDASSPISQDSFTPGKDADVQS